MPTKPNQDAYPTVRIEGHNQVSRIYYPGMTKRERFAEAAMIGLLASIGEAPTRATMEAIGTDAVGLADQLIAALNEPQKEDDAEPTEDTRGG